ncbi:MAG: hypothetical protein GX132_01495, partial [Erysipelotrichia bacterium]|nr:hypothetical protein [Erysipelotrichia bacterium]
MARKIPKVKQVKPRKKLTKYKEMNKRINAAMRKMEREYSGVGNLVLPQNSGVVIRRVTGIDVQFEDYHGKVRTVRWYGEKNSYHNLTRIEKEALYSALNRLQVDIAQPLALAEGLHKATMTRMRNLAQSEEDQRQLDYLFSGVKQFQDFFGSEDIKEFEKNYMFESIEEATEAAGVELLTNTDTMNLFYHAFGADTDNY